EQRRADCGEELGPRERADRPGGGGVEAGSGVAGAADEASGGVETRRQRLARGDRVGEVIARFALLIVGALTPGQPARVGEATGRWGGGSGRRRGEREGAGDARRGGDPAGGVALGTSTRNRVPISREAGGCAEVEAGEEAGDPTRLRAVAGPRQGQRDG